MKGYEHCIKEEHAVDAMIRLADELDGKLNIFATGPLTNIALAARIDPNFSTKINKLVVIGGAHWGMGNINCNGEHNIYSDPEAFKISLHEFGEKIELVTSECTYGHEFTPEDFEKMV